MFTEEFSFPTVSRESLNNLNETQSLWRISSGVDNFEENGKRSKSFSEVEGGVRNEIYEVDAEERMDMLWEDFNNDEFHDPSSYESDFDEHSVSPSIASRHYSMATFEGITKVDTMSMIHAKSEMGDMEDLKDRRLYDTERVKFLRKYGGSLSLKKQNFAMVMKIMKKLRLLQKIARVKRRSSLSP